MLSISMLLMGTMGVTVLVVIHPEFLSGNLPASYGLQLRVQAVLFGIMYFVLTAGLVIGWLSLPHQVMQEARDETLKPLADEFEYAIADIMPSSKQDANAIKAGTDRLAELKRRYELLQDTYPTWPLAIEQVRRLVATVSLPAAFYFSVTRTNGFPNSLLIPAILQPTFSNTCSENCAASANRPRCTWSSAGRAPTTSSISSRGSGWAKRASTFARTPPRFAV